MNNNKDKALIIVISLIAALLSWFYVVTERNPETTQNISDIEIEIRNENELNNSGLVVSNIDTTSIDVSIRGLRNEVININSTDINAYIDVVGYSEGSNKVPVEINLPENVELIDYNPKQVLCDFEAVINKSIDLEIDINGNEASGYYALQPDSSVNTVIVKGPRSVLNSIEKAVVFLDITEASESVVKRIPINVYNDKGIELDLEINPSIAEVTVPIYPIKEVEVDIPTSGEVMEGYRVKNIIIEPKTVLIAGRSEIIKDIDQIRCEPISIEEATNNIYSPAEFIEGNYYIIESVNPRIEVEIEEVLIKELTYNIDDIEVINLPEEFSIDTIEIPEESITITVEGFASVIEELAEEDVKITVDLTEGNEGANNVQLQIETEVEVENYQINPEVITVNLIVNEDINENNLEEETENQ